MRSPPDAGRLSPAIGTSTCLAASRIPNETGATRSTTAGLPLGLRVATSGARTADSHVRDSYTAGDQWPTRTVLGSARAAREPKCTTWRLRLRHRTNLLIYREFARQSGGPHRDAVSQIDSMAHPVSHRDSIDRYQAAGALPKPYFTLGIGRAPRAAPGTGAARDGPRGQPRSDTGDSPIAGRSTCSTGIGRSADLPRFYLGRGAARRARA